MRKAGILFTVAGLVAIGVLVYLQGPGAIAEAFGALGAGVLWMVPIYAVFLSLSAISWGMLFAGGRRLGHLPRFTGIWVGASLNTLVPTGTIGGEVVKARIITRYAGSSGMTVFLSLARPCDPGHLFEHSADRGRVVIGVALSERRGVDRQRGVHHRDRAAHRLRVLADDLEILVPGRDAHGRLGPAPLGHHRAAHLEHARAAGPRRHDLENRPGVESEIGRAHV